MEWHIEHSRNCDCRKPTEKLRKEIENYLKESNKGQISLKRQRLPVTTIGWFDFRANARASDCLEMFL